MVHDDSNSSGVNGVNEDVVLEPDKKDEEDNAATPSSDSLGAVSTAAANGIDSRNGLGQPAAKLEDGPLDDVKKDDDKNKINSEEAKKVASEELDASDVPNLRVSIETVVDTVSDLPAYVRANHHVLSFPEKVRELVRRNCGHRLTVFIAHVGLDSRRT